MPSILIVDDDIAIRDALSEALADLGHTPCAVADGAAALAWLAQHRADAVLLDLRMPGLDGMEVLRHIRGQAHPPPAAVLTAVPTSANTIEAMRLGAADHLAKPIGRKELSALVTRLLAGTGKTLSSPTVAGSDELIGSCAAWREMQKTIGLLADNDATVLLLGETGTGKEVIARAIHHYVGVQRPLLSPSIVPRYPGSCWRACCSAMFAVLSPVL